MFALQVPRHEEISELQQVSERFASDQAKRPAYQAKWKALKVRPQSLSPVRLASKSNADWVAAYSQFAALTCSLGLLSLHSHISGGLHQLQSLKAMC